LQFAKKTFENFGNHDEAKKGRVLVVSNDTSTL
jgi:hypothetical protein